VLTDERSKWTGSTNAETDKIHTGQFTGGHWLLLVGFENWIIASRYSLDSLLVHAFDFNPDWYVLLCALDNLDTCS